MSDESTSARVGSRTGRFDAPSDVAGLGTILGVWAHPDDEAYLSGGLMALARDAGSRVVCVTATRGELGTPDPEIWPPERLAAERVVELARCLDILGVTEHEWLGYPDGECDRVDAAAAVARLRAVMRDVRPGAVLTFGPDGITGHPDHRTVSAWTTAAFADAAPPGARLLYSAIPAVQAQRWSALDMEVFSPGFPIIADPDRVAVDLLLDPQTAGRKVRALAAQATQTAGLIAAVGLERYTTLVGHEVFVDAPAADLVGDVDHRARYGDRP
jgi:LmbE family N-acetylglucosaminyl deacetylase